ncbi:formate dehydrogenase subunit delta [Aureimonas phyllosphaerae]|uniref:Formate dehydrogenase subunit delta n=1 Tax=Aureimonas phyllosphaerae TaxID=1166078 RepID=A0A7W6BVB0_9HYPH|nr:formate dehydrogenase subunit delta [Aureimonas phyllosphaerae]MBB3936744.1 formate dehydrogenase subunit delta [Aureimonas phyllosphaerae]MBB3960393.1 formate dehydrogenase subunit delta [Aureimonas phyllosphaerae]SFF22411.1 formate dehydrogenase subunit delta [Aureimonas phyllosphaerae]
MSAAPEPLEGETQKLVTMVNQVARFFESQAHEPGVLGVADHVAAFWTPRMRDMIFAHVDAGGADLRPLALEGLASLRARPPKAAHRRLEAAGGLSVGTKPGSDAG